MKGLRWLLVPVLTMISICSVSEEVHHGPIRELVQENINVWVTSPDIIAAIKAQNSKHASLSQAEIDALDKKWRAETKSSSHPMIDGVLSSAVSKKLQSIRDQNQGLFTEIFIMDNKGLNVAQSDVTSDYWQGDEAKWKETFLKGPGAIHISEIEVDESSQLLQSQASVSIVDPATKEVIGAVTVGVNVDEL